MPRPIRPHDVIQATSSCKRGQISLSQAESQSFQAQGLALMCELAIRRTVHFKNITATGFEMALNGIQTEMRILPLKV